MGSRSPSLTALGEGIAWSLLDAVPLAIFVVDATGQIVFANDQAGVRLGHGLDRLLNRPIDEVLPDARHHDGIAVISLSEVADRADADDLIAASRATRRRAERVAAIADERDRIAADLHDTIIQQLFAEALNLHAALAVAEERVRPRIESTIAALDATIRDVRAVVFALRKPGGAILDGMRRRLFDVVVEVTDTLGTEPRLEFDGPIESIDGAVAEVLPPVLRTALTHAVLNSVTGQVYVDVEVRDDLVLRVTHDGDGVADPMGRRALQDLSGRAEGLGGDCTVARSGDDATILTWRVPIGRRPV